MPYDPKLHGTGADRIRPVKEPGPDHPITIEPANKHIIVRSGETVIADTNDALSMVESGHDAVYYVPAADVDWSVLTDSDTSSYCPYKGDASYASLDTTDSKIADVLWKYNEPYPAVGQIKDRVAFYTDRVELTTS
jgi:uncharacterized protein (DUF427 family)